jgi:hypothetical protein
MGRSYEELLTGFPKWDRTAIAFRTDERRAARSKLTNQSIFFGAESAEHPARAADEPTAPLIEPQPAVGLAREADASRYADFADRSHCRAEPERTRAGAQVQPIEPPVDAHRGGEAAGTAGKIKQARESSVAPHQRDPFERFQCAYQNAAADAACFA